MIMVVIKFIIQSVTIKQSSTGSSTEEEWWSFLFVLGEVNGFPVLGLLLLASLGGAILGALILGLSLYCCPCCSRRSPSDREGEDDFERMTMTGSSVRSRNSPNSLSRQRHHMDIIAGAPFSSGGAGFSASRPPRKSYGSGSQGSRSNSSIFAQNSISRNNSYNNTPTNSQERNSKVDNYNNNINNAIDYQEQQHSNNFNNTTTSNHLLPPTNTYRNIPSNGANSDTEDAPFISAPMNIPESLVMESTYSVPHETVPVKISTWGPKHYPKQDHNGRNFNTFQHKRT